ncbi:MAG: hypothetical protein Q4A31_09820 [Corynebacterium sp.]|uniref:EcsC family protein n=1 Tax=Corynebacterium sp. TaxID=1720 RepID=UPI0026DC906E|nr:hypothetical protein [Corynebacterium sp.]MDO4762203.1 hypothetical protein [Corynebacterium sp.]
MSKPARTDIVTDVFNSNSHAIMAEKGPVAKVLINALDKAATMQSGLITKYVDSLTAKDSSVDSVQKTLDKHFLLTVTGSGAGAGSAAAVPGIGFLTGAAAVSAESLLFLDAATFYAIASAYLRGIDISDPERRKAILLIAVLGSEGTLLADTAFNGDSAMSILKRSSGAKLTELNGFLLKTAAKKISKSVRLAWLGKLMPLGIGAVLGSIANRKIGQKVIEHVHTALR